MFAVIRVVRGEASYEKKGVGIFEGNALLANRQGVARIFEVGILLIIALCKLEIIAGKSDDRI